MIIQYALDIEPDNDDAYRLYEDLNPQQVNKSNS